jgi:hypothetical protein
MKRITNYKCGEPDNGKEGSMAKRYHQSIVLILTVVLTTACTAIPPTPSPATAEPLTPTTLAATVAHPSPTRTVQPPGEAETDSDQDNSNAMESNRMNIQIGDTVLTATLFENSSVDALKEALSEGPITIHMRDYGSMEKVGPLGMELPRNDQQITTEAGDIILYQGNALVIYYASNSWNFTRLGKINDVSAEELKEILGDGNVTVTLSLP